MIVFMSSQISDEIVLYILKIPVGVKFYIEQNI